MKKIIRSIPFAVVLLYPTLALAASVFGGFDGSGGTFGISWGGGGGMRNYGCSSTICGIAGTVLYLINNVLVPVLFAVAFIIFLYGIAKAYIFSYGDADARSEGHRFVFWGVVAFAIMVSIWGLVNIVANTFGLAGYYAPPLPTSFSN